MSPAIRGNNYAKGNNGGAPEGNSNAAGNDGGAPEYNTNAVKHHGWSDSLKHYHRLSGAPKELADRILGDYIDDYALVHEMDAEEVKADETVMNDLRRLAANYNQWMCASVPGVKEGFIIEEEREYEDEDGEIHTYPHRKVNPSERACWRLTQKWFKLREKLEVDAESVREARRKQQQYEVTVNHVPPSDDYISETESESDPEPSTSPASTATNSDSDPDERDQDVSDSETGSSNESEESTSPFARTF